MASRVVDCVSLSRLCRSAGHPAVWMVDDIISQEPKAERSLMHRFNIALV